MQNPFRYFKSSPEVIRLTVVTYVCARTTFYRWYDRYQIGGSEALEDQSPHPSRVWNRIPDDVRQRIVDLGLGCAGAISARTGGALH